MQQTFTISHNLQYMRNGLFILTFKIIQWRTSPVRNAAITLFKHGRGGGGGPGGPGAGGTPRGPGVDGKGWLVVLELKSAGVLLTSSPEIRLLVPGFGFRWGCSPFRLRYISALYIYVSRRKLNGHATGSIDGPSTTPYTAAGFPNR